MAEEAGKKYIVAAWKLDSLIHSGAVIAALKCVRESWSFTPLGLIRLSHFYPRLTPWAAFLRRFAANNMGLCFRCRRNSSYHARTEALRHPKIGASVGFGMTPLQIMPTGQCTTARLTSNSDLSSVFRYSGSWG
jgi:hypothetical protein